MAKLSQKQWIICQKDGQSFFFLFAREGRELFDSVVSVRPQADGSFLAKREDSSSRAFVDDLKKSGWSLARITKTQLDGEQKAIAAWTEKSFAQGLLCRGCSPIRSLDSKVKAKEKFLFQIPVIGASKKTSVSVSVFVSSKTWAKSKVSPDALASIFESAFESTYRHWGWVPDSLTVTIDPSMTPARMGMAASGDYAAYRIFLNYRLLASYTAKSIWRVIVHELAHLKREREPVRSPQGSGGHDHRFCELLGLVDELVASNPEDCMRFRDDRVIDEPVAGTIFLQFHADMTKPWLIGELWYSVGSGKPQVNRYKFQRTSDLLEVIQRVGGSGKDLKAYARRRDGSGGFVTNETSFYDFFLALANNQRPAVQARILDALNAPY